MQELSNVQQGERSVVLESDRVGIGAVNDERCFAKIYSENFCVLIVSFIGAGRGLL